MFEMIEMGVHGGFIFFDDSMIQVRRK